jgi:hypothetical protein
VLAYAFIVAASKPFPKPQSRILFGPFTGMGRGVASSCSDIRLRIAHARWRLDLRERMTFVGLC